MLEERALPRDIADVPELLPAGLCTFDPYLRSACGNAPAARFALVLASAADPEAAELSLRRGRVLGLAAGYPFAATFEEMPAKDASRRGIAVVAGLFAEREHAENYARHLPEGAEVVELASYDERAFSDPSTAVELTEDTPAWTQGDLEAVEAELDRALAERWVDLAEQKVRRARALAVARPSCTLRRGRVFVSGKQDIYRLSRNYAPVRCDDGRAAWVPWRATRLEAVVTRAAGEAFIHQIVFVECDHATLETRRFDAGSTAQPLGTTSEDPC